MVIKKGLQICLGTQTKYDEIVWNPWMKQIEAYGM